MIHKVVNEDRGSEEEDYRRSHVGKGMDYDESLSQTPWDAYMTDHQKRILVRVLGELKPGVRVLDFACGTGRITQVIEERGFETLGLDISPTMLEVARQKCPRTTFILADGSQEISVPPVDALTSFRFFGNAQDDLRRKCLKQMVSYLRPGGLLIVNNHRNPWTVRNLLLRARGGQPDETLSHWHMTNLLQSSGLKVVRTFGVGFWMFRAQWTMDYAKMTSAGSRLEWLSNLPGAVAFCPDVVFVAQKRP